MSAAGMVSSVGRAAISTGLSFLLRDSNARVRDAFMSAQRGGTSAFHEGCQVRHGSCLLVYPDEVLPRGGPVNEETAE